MSDEHLRLYRYFLRHPGHEAAQAVAAFGLDQAEVGEALAALQGMGLVRLSERQSVLVSDPTVAVEWLVERQLGELKSATDQVAAARKVIPVLAEEHRHGLEETPVGEIERVDGVDAIRERLTELAFFTFRELTALLPNRWQPESIAQARESDLRMLRRGIRWRTVVGPDARADPATVAYLRELVGLGAEVRCTDQAIRRMVIWDRSVAMVPVDPDDYQQATLVVRQPGVVANTVAWFDQVWAAARELPTAEAAGDGQAAPPLSDIERRVLDVLTRTDKDEAAAREMGVSLRTFRRYIADIMLRLGAANRFQAGLLAKEKGWI
ncbi:sugar-specific transcriptional regulator TrmB/DNA-binding CsgD family transcriptional regulator [Kitasatospora gansuensis]|uniref:Sugar-specific transcriptional regulator TrmB/DNA-binding CsgD family transcriptional regulator n=1 Tax=Kitasatospora gansuensis TaxID=258050 RepID=A0A7W7SCW1_9ACTN|nr:helix-turn-helix transcriptional regulator [Kitasatospora gansuensis]MBB4948160.1 sugar-specific transcriptional regulator TrmB/DNA-binding CsgD family transcriptional regulator [Kitasatospora gansuensis]